MSKLIFQSKVVEELYKIQQGDNYAKEFNGSRNPEERTTHWLLQIISKQRETLTFIEIFCGKNGELDREKACRFAEKEALEALDFFPPQEGEEDEPPKSE